MNAKGARQDDRAAIRHSRPAPVHPRPAASPQVNPAEPALRIQNEEDAVDEEKERIVSALRSDFEHVDELGNYDIYHRIDPNAPKTTDDDDNGDDSNDDDDGKP